VLGLPRLHFRATGSTNDHARALAAAGAPHGALVTTTWQMAGRGRQGRAWTAPPGQTLAASLVLRGALDPLLPLRAGLAVADVAGPGARVKWPNDVLVGGRKVAGILVEGRPQEDWAVLGIGVNVAIRPEELPAELRDRAGTLGRRPEDVEAVLHALLAALGPRLAEPSEAVLDALRARDALLGRRVAWDQGEGTGAGIADDGALLVVAAGGLVRLDAGEVHLLG
jgi:BirA family transcriptional regulator, biotin operon repressor / biotin---[acetyl-CoA-carboxylase] ligase